MASELQARRAWLSPPSHTARAASPSPDPSPPAIPAPYHVGSYVTRCHLACALPSSTTPYPTFPFMSYIQASTPYPTLLHMPLPMHPITPLLWRGSGAGPSSLARRCSCCSSAACCPEAAHYRPRRPRQRRPPASRARRGLRRRPRRPGAACPIAWPKKVAAIERAAATAQRSLSADIHTACTCVPTPAQVRCLVRQQVVG